MFRDTSIRGVVVDALAAALTPAPAVWADVLVLKSGTAYVGEVLERKGDQVVFRGRVKGEWTTLTIDRAQIRELFEDPGNQADESGARERAEGAGPTATDASPAGAPSEPRSSDLVVVIPLQGQVGGLIDGSVAGTFDAEMLADCLARAQAADAALVVLDIRSPGGFLDEMEAICRTILEQRGRTRVVALAGEALSAAAVIALCCEDLVVRPEARVGAAVMVRDSALGLTALEAKLASPHHALQRQFMAESQRPYELLQAMTIQEAQLWWSATAGFTDDPHRAAGGEGFVLVDGATTVLTMIAEDALRWGVARGVARDGRELAVLLGFPDGARIVEYGDIVQRYLADTDRRLAQALDQFRSYFNSLSRLHDVLGQIQSAGRRGAADEARRGRDEAERLVRTLQAAAGAIRRLDRRLLARRTDIPHALIEQIDSDAQAIEAMGRLLREDSRSALRQAQHSAASILERWRTLLTF